jgi:hypothetical protein
MTGGVTTTPPGMMREKAGGIFIRHCFCSCARFKDVAILLFSPKCTKKPEQLLRVENTNEPDEGFFPFKKDTGHFFFHC